MYHNGFTYAEKYYDDTYEYRHIHVPKDKLNMLPKDGTLLNESQWRSLGIAQSEGWVHYLFHKPDPGVLLFRRPLDYAQRKAAGKV